MKRLVMAALAAATFAAPLAVSSEAAAQRRDRDWDRDGRGDRDRDDDRRRHRGDRDRDWDRDDRRDDRRNYREGRRDQRQWDRRRYNGYNYRGRWYYGPPPVQYRDHADYGYRSWRRGDRLPSYYRNNYYVVNDYDRYGARRPPRGYHYVRDDRGDLLLVAIATGVILSIIANN